MTHNNQKSVTLVGTPCHIIAAEKMEHYPDILGDSPVDFKLGLFCMENFSHTYLKEFLKQNEIEMDDIDQFRVEKGHLWTYLKNGDIFKVPLSKAKVCMRKNCQVCMDYTSELADLSVGSVGSDPGWSTIIIRTEKGLKALSKAENQGYIETKPFTQQGLKLLENLANKKKKENKEEIKKRESVARPVLYRRYINDAEFTEEVSSCQFKDLKSDVIDVGSCVLCGACYYVCPENIVSIEDRKPQLKGTCPEECNLCYVACPRTYLSQEVLSRDLDQKALGDYLKIVSARAEGVDGQDGGVATAILNCILDENITDEVVVVDKMDDNPWKPEAILTSQTEEVIKAAGTKYSACPVFKVLKSNNEMNSNKDSKKEVS
ncbi:Coenzyme F420 hydrogenase/dehydrogenase, beta subunit C-terminal domain [Methanobacterium sp.]|uniref:Coenzyme F420 hydrogenase/dehydrogenase, beta subunit C-terminal domain n=1 Tax=Methanobacterium sp. TaxID=2164 RepID=UPI0025EA3EA9|nr:Coenzyme F420 hydrogenase/dehydrogenase, beta subunit C-terminal domain [Methanobacterium sp.]MBI5458327.1 Coenzyme F420 hydrogenase/dehydrogenase, beta subunit C-terminal domain [Methanobacterium sp.]